MAESIQGYMPAPSGLQAALAQLVFFEVPRSSCSSRHGSSKSLKVVLTVLRRGRPAGGATGGSACGAAAPWHRTDSAGVYEPLSLPVRGEPGDTRSHESEHRDPRSALRERLQVLRRMRQGVCLPLHAVPLASSPKP